MNDHKQIDDLFREKLSGREISMSDQDWMLMQKRLPKGGSGFNWKVFFLLIACTGIVAAFIYKSEKCEVAEINVEVNIPENQNAIKSTTEQERKNAFAENAVQENGTSINENDPSNSVHQANSNQENANSDVSSPLIENVNAKSASDYSASSNNDKGIVNDTASNQRKSNNRVQQTKSKRSNVSSKNASLSSDKFNDRNFNTGDPNGQKDDLFSTILSDVSKNNATQLSNDPNELNPSLKFMNGLPGYFRIERNDLAGIKSLPLPSKVGLWALQVSAIAGVSKPIFKATDEYLKRRKEDESQSNAFGLEVSVARNLGAIRLTSGLIYYRNGENVTYSGNKAIQETQLDSSIVQVTHIEMQIDSFPSGGVLLIDTTYTTVVTDSLVIQDTVINRVISDPSISAHNGKTTLSHLMIPLRLSTKLYADRKSNKILLNTGLELDYVVAKKAYYLSPSQDALLSASEFSTYRNFMVNGVIGLEYNRAFMKDKCYVIIDPYIRYNLMSWNKDFQHRYLGYGIRFGVGYKF
jgi:hypothetical protein